MRQIIRHSPAPTGHWVGDGFPVRTIFSHFDGENETSPFLMLDYAGPTYFDPADTPRGVGVHPHKGFETVTIVYQGELEHGDSAGNGGIIGPGDVQWMTAGSGILHKELHSKSFTENGGTLEMFQLWVNLPAKDKGVSPGYQAIQSTDIPQIKLPHSDLRVIAGTFDGIKGAAQTYTPMNVWDLQLNASAEMEFEPEKDHTVAIVLQSGKASVNNVVLSPAEHIVLGPTGPVVLHADQGSRLLILTGEPIEEPIAAHGPFVMNTKEEIRQTMDEFRNGKFGTL